MSHSVNADASLGTATEIAEAQPSDADKPIAPDPPAAKPSLSKDAEAMASPAVNGSEDTTARATRDENIKVGDFLARPPLSERLVSLLHRDRRAPARIARDRVIRMLSSMGTFAVGAANPSRAIWLALALTVGWIAGAISVAPPYHVLEASSRPASPEATSALSMLQWRGALALGAGEREETRHLADAVRSLATSFDSLRSSTDVRTLERIVKTLRDAVELAKTDVAAAMTQVSVKLDRLDRDPAAKLSQIIERLDAIERELPAPTTTGSIAHGPAADPSSTGRPPLDPDAKPQPKPLAGWMVTDVYDGMALVEGRGGVYEVAPGDTLPGAGRVVGIERRGKGWALVTSRGVIMSRTN